MMAKPLAPPNPKLPNYQPHRKRGGELDWFELACELVLTQQQFEDEFGSGLPDDSCEAPPKDNPSPEGGAGQASG